MTESRRLLPFEERFRSWMNDRSMAWEEVELGCGDEGSVVAYHLRPARAARVVCTVHGAGNDALFGWVGLYKQLLLGGSEIFTFDLPGHGRGCRTRFSPTLARDLIVSALERYRSSPLPIHAVGVSLGGSMLLGALPALQDRLASASLIVAPLQIVLSTRSLLNEVGLAAFRLVWREREHYGWTGLVPSFGPFKRGTYPLHLSATPPAGAFGYVAALNDFLRAEDLLSRAAEVELPVLMIYGDRDLVVPAAQGELLATLMSGVELELVEGTHLTTPLEPATTHVLLSWLEKWG